MDFITGLPRSNRGHDSIWVIVDRLTKVAHFILVKTTHNGRELADLYISRIVSLHGVPKTIVFDRGTQFTSRFWAKLHEALGTKLSFSTTYHLQTGGQTERVNQILEDMLRACILSYGAKYEVPPKTELKFKYKLQIRKQKKKRIQDKKMGKPTADQAGPLSQHSISPVQLTASLYHSRGEEHRRPPLSHMDATTPASSTATLPIRLTPDARNFSEFNRRPFASVPVNLK
jgi:transposase InsO family protein